MGLFISRLYHIRRAERIGMNVYAYNENEIHDHTNNAQTAMMMNGMTSHGGGGGSVMSGTGMNTHNQMMMLSHTQMNTAQTYGGNSHMMGSPTSYMLSNGGGGNTNTMTSHMGNPYGQENNVLSYNNTNTAVNPYMSSGATTKSVQSSMARDQYQYANLYAQSQAMSNQQNNPPSVYTQQPHTPTHLHSPTTPHTADYTQQQQQSYNTTPSHTNNAGGASIGANNNNQSMVLPNQIHTRNSSVVSMNLQQIQQAQQVSTDGLAISVNHLSATATTPSTAGGAGIAGKTGSSASKHSNRHQRVKQNAVNVLQRQSTFVQRNQNYTTTGSKTNGHENPTASAITISDDSTVGGSGSGSGSAGGGTGHSTSRRHKRSFTLNPSKDKESSHQIKQMNQSGANDVYHHQPLTPPPPTHMSNAVAGSQQQQHMMSMMNKQYSHSHLLTVYSPQRTPPVVGPGGDEYENNSQVMHTPLSPTQAQNGRKLKRSGTVAMLKKQRSQQQLSVTQNHPPLPISRTTTNLSSVHHHSGSSTMEMPPLSPSTTQHRQSSHNMTRQHTLQNYLSSPTATHNVNHSLLHDVNMTQPPSQGQYIMSNNGNPSHIAPTSQGSYQSSIAGRTPSADNQFHHTISISPPTDHDVNHPYIHTHPHPMSPTHPHTNSHSLQKHGSSVSLYPPISPSHIHTHTANAPTINGSNHNAMLYDHNSMIHPSASLQMSHSSDTLQSHYNQHSIIQKSKSHESLIRDKQGLYSNNHTLHPYNNSVQPLNLNPSTVGMSDHTTSSIGADTRRSYTPSLRREAFGLPPMLNTSIVQQNRDHSLTNGIVSLQQHSYVNKSYQRSSGNDQLQQQQANQSQNHSTAHDHATITITTEHKSFMNENSVTYFQDGVSPLNAFNQMNNSILPTYNPHQQSNHHIQALKDSFTQHPPAQAKNEKPGVGNSRAPQLHRNNSLSDLNSASSSDWRRGEMLGAGAYGRVYLGLHLVTGQLMAVKQVTLVTAHHNRDKNNDAQDAAITSLQQEIAVMQTLTHDNIVNYLGTERTTHALNIFLEYVPGGSIASLLRKFGKFNAGLVKIYTKQILSGLCYLHEHNIAHRDIKGGNILLDNNGICKLADFGAATQLDELAIDDPKSLHGTVNWMAPEVIKQTGTGKAADIWSMGCTILEMLTGKAPWSEYTSNVAAMYHIANSNNMPNMPPKEILDDNGVHFLTMCFQRQPHERPTAKHLLKHPWLTTAVPSTATAAATVASPVTSPSDHTPLVMSPTSEESSRHAMNEWITEHNTQVTKRIHAAHRRLTSKLSITADGSESPSVSSSATTSQSVSNSNLPSATTTATVTSTMLTDGIRHTRAYTMNTPTVDEHVHVDGEVVHDTVNMNVSGSPTTTTSTSVSPTNTATHSNGETPLVVVTEDSNDKNITMISPAASTVDDTPITVTSTEEIHTNSRSPSYVTDPEHEQQQQHASYLIQSSRVTHESNGVVESEKRMTHEAHAVEGVNVSMDVDGMVGAREKKMSLNLPIQSQSAGTLPRRLTNRHQHNPMNHNIDGRPGSNPMNRLSNGGARSNESSLLLRSVSLNPSRHASTSTRHHSSQNSRASNPRSLKQADALFEALTEMNKQKQLASQQHSSIDEHHELDDPHPAAQHPSVGADAHDVLEYINKSKLRVEANVSKLLEKNRSHRMTGSYLASKMHSRQNSSDGDEVPTYENYSVDGQVTSANGDDINQMHEEGQESEKNRAQATSQSADSAVVG